MVKNFTQLTPVHTSVAPNSAAQGTGMSSFGQAVLYTRPFIGLVGTDADPGFPPREAPV